MRFQAITQIILIVLALTMIFAVIRPMFGTIEANQEELREFRTAVSTAGQFNNQLQDLLDRARSFDSADMTALSTYIPSEIDQLSVSRDIVSIVEENEMTVRGLSAEDAVGGATAGENADEGTVVEEPISPEGTEEVAIDPELVSEVSLASEANKLLIKQRFDLDVIGTYDQMKEVLVDFERNAYPLRLVEFTFDLDEESDLYSFGLTLETYALQSK